MRARAASLPSPGQAAVRNMRSPRWPHQFRSRAECPRFVAEAVDPMHIRLTPEPGQLPFGIVAMALLGGGYRGIFAQRACEDGHSLAIAQRIESLHRPITREQAARLLDEAR